jgi:hypothetical protein
VYLAKKIIAKSRFSQYLLFMTKKIFYGLLVLFTVVACNQEVLLENQTPTKQKISDKEIVYFDNVNVEIAQIMAQSFYSDMEKQSAEVATVDSIMDWNGNTAIYIFNFTPSGFVLTSADIRNEPIIGYSNEGGFYLEEEEMPEALVCNLAETMIFNRWLRDTISIDEDSDSERQKIGSNNATNWLTELQRIQVYWQIKISDDRPIFIDPCATAHRTLISTEIVDELNYYCKTKWGQYEPYNYFAPNHYPAGCVAVAVAQIMKFHRYPTSTFNWSIMPDVCYSSYTNTSAGDWEVARLIKDVGDKVDMNYAANGSSSNIYKARKALVREYDYSSSADVDNWDYSKIVNEIKKDKHPLYVRGDGTKEVIIDWGWLHYSKYSNGHAYIIDGITNFVKTYTYICSGEEKTCSNTYELLHYNFGWGGFYNWWYSNAIRDLNDGSYEDWDYIREQVFPNFRYNKKCIYNIKP